jgi:hypothetical protein
VGCRYVIHNQTGVNLWYWVRASEDNPQPAGRKAFLAAYRCAGWGSGEGARDGGWGGVKVCVWGGGGG